MTGKVITNFHVVLPGWCVRGSMALCGHTDDNAIPTRLLESSCQLCLLESSSPLELIPHLYDKNQSVPVVFSLCNGIQCLSCQHGTTSISCIDYIAHHTQK